ncbi:hypothetical protein [Absiella sp. AM29-15]|uniref:hypothetical protein n=1 Tax=Absiella sp. AM29-15 TaxID=2292278 RepID=UPI001313FA04|nr:hypothetical protein [Absiella sp. AM29-15]
MPDSMKFELLANCIKEINVKAGSAAKRAENQSMTLHLLHNKIRNCFLEGIQKSAS